MRKKSLEISTQLLTILLACLVSSCSVSRDERKPNLVIITMDTTRADRLGAYGCGEVETPNIDRLSRRGVTFERAYSAVPLTLPSHSTIMTGLYPPAHGVRNNGNYRLPAEAVSLAEHLKSSGYSTAAFVGAFVLDSQFGLDQGFDLYYDSFLNLDREKKPFKYAERDAGSVTALALDWLKSREAGAPFFLWVHYFDPHHPYDPPEPFKQRYRDEPYLGEIAFTDKCIGRLIEALEDMDLLERTLIILTSDHGESLGEHDESSHGIFLYQATMRVPLIMVLEGVLPENERVEGEVTLADIFPTVCEILEVPYTGYVDGKSVMGLVHTGTGEKRSLYMESMYPRENYGWSPITGIVREGWKYLRVPVPELYDLTADPVELRNLAVDRASLLSEFDSLLTVVEDESRASSVAPGDAFDRMDEATRRSLEKLGYIWSRSEAEDEKTGGKADPKDMIWIVNRTDDAMALLSGGRNEEAVGVLSDILAKDPDNVTAHNLLGQASRRLGDVDRAAKHWRRALELNPDYVETHRNLGILYKEQGDLEKALDEFEEVIRLNPEYTKAYVDRGLTLQLLGRGEEAESSLRRAIELEPDFIKAHLFLGNLFKEEEKLDSALVHYLLALAVDTANVEARRKTAKLLLKKGDIEGAIRHFRYIASSEADLGSYLDLGIALDRAGRRLEAVEVYRQAAALDTISAELFNNMGIALLGLERFDEAEKSFDRAIGIEPDYAEPYFNLGNLYRQLGRKRDALRSYRMFLEVWKRGERPRRRAIRIIHDLESEI